VLKPGGEPLVAVVDPDVLADGDQGREAVGESANGRTGAAGVLTAGSRTRCSLTEVGVLLTAKPMV